MSKRTVKPIPGVTGKLDIAKWFGLTEDTPGNRELVVRRGELLDVLETLERARRRNTWFRKLLRWIAGASLVDLNPVKILSAKRQEMDG